MERSGRFSEQEVGLGRVDVPIDDYGLALRRLLPTLLLHRCPACGQGSIFRNALYQETCPVCGVRYEREAGGLIGSMVLNHFLTIVLLLTSAIVLVRHYGFADWLTPLLLAECVLLIALFYQPSKALYLCFVWVLGFVHRDHPQPRQAS